MKKPHELRTGDTVPTMHGEGILVMIKPGNFRNQNYKVQFANGSSKWYTLTQLQQAYKVAA